MQITATVRQGAGQGKQQQLPNVSISTDRQARKEMSVMPETKLTNRQLEELKTIHETLKESELVNENSEAWKAILRLGWLVDDLTGVGVRTWAR